MNILKKYKVPLFSRKTSLSGYMIEPNGGYVTSGWSQMPEAITYTRAERVFESGELPQIVVTSIDLKDVWKNRIMVVTPRRGKNDPEGGFVHVDYKVVGLDIHGNLQPFEGDITVYYEGKDLEYLLDFATDCIEKFPQLRADAREVSGTIDISQSHPITVASTSNYSPNPSSNGSITSIEVQRENIQIQRGKGYRGRAIQSPGNEIAIAVGRVGNRKIDWAT